jgi:hypothetical protein
MRLRNQGLALTHMHTYHKFTWSARQTNLQQHQQRARGPDCRGIVSMILTNWRAGAHFDGSGAGRNETQHHYHSGIFHHGDVSCMKPSNISVPAFELGMEGKVPIADPCLGTAHLDLHVPSQDRLSFTQQIWTQNKLTMKSEERDMGLAGFQSLSRKSIGHHSVP